MRSGASKLPFRRADSLMPHSHVVITVEVEYKNVIGFTIPVAISTRGNPVGSDIFVQYLVGLNRIRRGVRWQE